MIYIKVFLACLIEIFSISMSTILFILFMEYKNFLPMQTARRDVVCTVHKSFNFILQKKIVFALQ